MKDKVLDYLLKNNISLACCESCTGGMFAAAVTDKPGISKIFDRGLVTYSNRAKMEELGVKAETLAEYGAVSMQTAAEMAEGLHKVSGCDVCVSVTGYAGPLSPDYPEEPVGLFYIGIWYMGKCKALKFFHETPERSSIRERAVNEMFIAIYNTVISCD